MKLIKVYKKIKNNNLWIILEWDKVQHTEIIKIK